MGFNKTSANNKRRQGNQGMLIYQILKGKTFRHLIKSEARVDVAEF